MRVESRGYGLYVAGAGFDVARGEKILGVKFKLEFDVTE